jgi:hypothetical protein
MTSALLRNGPDHLRSLEVGLRDWMDRHGFETLDQLRGRLSQRSVPDPATFERANYIKTLASHPAARPAEGPASRVPLERRAISGHGRRQRPRGGRGDPARPADPHPARRPTRPSGPQEAHLPRHACAAASRSAVAAVPGPPGAQPPPRVRVDRPGRRRHRRSDRYYLDGDGGMGWKLAGLLSVAHAQSPDVARSAAGRAAAEAIWLPTALLPRFGVRWSATAADQVSAHIQVGTRRWSCGCGWMRPGGSLRWPLTAGATPTTVAIWLGPVRWRDHRLPQLPGVDHPQPGPAGVVLRRGSVAAYAAATDALQELQGP